MHLVQNDGSRLFQDINVEIVDGWLLRIMI